MFKYNELITIYNALVEYKGNSLEVSENHCGTEVKVSELIEKVKTLGLGLMENGSPTKTYLAEFNGHVIEGQMIVVDTTLEKAYHSVIDKVGEMGLLEKNKGLTLCSLKEIELNQKNVVITFDGDM